METFNPNQPCTKCGFRVATTRYVPVSHERIEIIDKVASEWQEHLARQCVRCGYKWAESVLAVEPEPVAPAAVTDEIPF